jgi:ATP-dependent protease ClpP protease subunit
MPLPSPDPNEGHDDFIERCMGDDTMQEEYPDGEQREAVCEAQWERSMNRSRAKAFRARTGRGYYRMKALSEDTTEVLVYDVIDWLGVSAEDFVAELNAIDTPNINLRINSPGGDVFDGVAIAQALRQHPAKVHTQVDGLAASIASVIALAGDTVTMAKGAFFMIHQPWSIALGNAKDMRDTADLLDKISGSLVATYQDATGLEAETLREWMDAETWMTDQEAVANGFAGQIAGEEAEPQAGFDLSIFANAPNELTEGAPRDAGQPTESDLERALRDAGLSRTAARAFVAEGKGALDNPRDAGSEGKSEIAALLRERITH